MKIKFLALVLILVYVNTIVYRIGIRGNFSTNSLGLQLPLNVIFNEA